MFTSQIQRMDMRSLWTYLQGFSFRADVYCDTMLCTDAATGAMSLDIFVAAHTLSASSLYCMLVTTAGRVERR